MIGKVLAGRYEVRERLGGGGMAVVFRGLDTFLGRSVSIKVLRPEYASDEEFVRRFRREAQAVARLSHPNIVGIYDLGREGEVNYIVMELVEGRSLQEWIEEGAPLPTRRAAEIACQVLEGLEHAHQNGVIHRDVKPGNILIDRAGRVKVTDFGIAQAATAATLVHTGTVIGSAYYLSPEQARGKPVDARSDLYSAGVVLYEMLTGRRPFEGENGLAVAMQHLQSAPTPPRRLNPAIPPALERIVLRALAKEPVRRYPSVQAFQDDLRAWLAGEPLPSERNPVPAPAPERTQDLGPPQGDGDPDGPDEGEEGSGGGRRRIWTFVLVLALLVAAASAGVAALFEWFRVPTVEVPNVEKKSLVEADRLLAARGLDWTPAGNQYSDTVPLNHVISQDPPPGQEVRTGRVVSLIFSLGVELLQVPDVVNQHRIEAENRLRNAGFEVEVEARYDNNTAADYVIDQRPPGGGQASRGSTIHLTVSRGPEPVPVEIPDWRGRPLAEARDELLALGLRLGALEERRSQYEAGLVVDQRPSPGERVETGSTVNLVVSQGCEHRAERTFTLQSERPEEVRVVLRDAAGEREIHRQEHEPGEPFALSFCWAGQSGEIEVFVAGERVERQRLSS